MRSRSDSDPKNLRRSARFEPPAAAPSDDIDDWLDRKPSRARGKTRRAIRHTSPSTLGTSGPRRRKSAQSTVEIGCPPRSGRADTPRKRQSRASVSSPDKTSAAKAPRVRRPMWLRLRRLCAFLCVVLLLEGAAALVSSHHFAVGEVAVEGAKETSDAELDAVCASLLGQNFLRANRAAAEAKARAIAPVASASVVRDWTAWPPRLIVRISERQPFARVGGGKTWLVVDENGMPFRRARREDETLYAVTGPRLVPELGKSLEGAAWKPVVQFAGILKKDAERAGGWNLRRVYFDRHGFASLRLTGGKSDETLVQLGASNWSEKLQTARWALADFASRGRHAESINLISSSVTTWTPRVPAKTEEATEGTQADSPASGDAVANDAAADGMDTANPAPA